MANDQFTQTGYNVDASGNVTCLTVTPTYRKRTYTAKTTAYTAVAGDDVIAYTTLSAPRTVTLPLAASVPIGNEITLRDWANNAGTNNITAAPTSPDTIVGPTTVSTNGGQLILVSNGVDKWYSTKA